MDIATVTVGISKEYSSQEWFRHQIVLGKQAYFQSILHQERLSLKEEAAGGAANGYRHSHERRR